MREFHAASATAYELTRPTTPGSMWTGTALHTFVGPPGDGAYPSAPLTPGPGGVFYGTTGGGGSGTGCVWDGVTRAGFAAIGEFPRRLPVGAPAGNASKEVSGGARRRAHCQGVIVVDAKL